MQLWSDERVIPSMPDESRAIGEFHDDSPIQSVGHEVAGDAAQEATMGHSEAFFVLQAEPKLAMLRRRLGEAQSPGRVEYSDIVLHDFSPFLLRLKQQQQQFEPNIKAPHIYQD